jgi:hypothetical protein
MGLVYSSAVRLTGPMVFGLLCRQLRLGSVLTHSDGYAIGRWLIARAADCARCVRPL